MPNRAKVGQLWVGDEIEESPDGWCAGRPARSKAVKVRYDEGIANHVGPEPCVGIREGVGEAPVGKCAGQPLSGAADKAANLEW
jgi:hypothetical protein